MRCLHSASRAEEEVADVTTDAEISHNSPSAQSFAMTSGTRNNLESLAGTATVRDLSGERRVHRHLATQLDYLLTYGLSCATSLCGMIAFRLAHTNLGDIGFAEYALMRRVVAFLVPMLSMGMAVAITKKVARQVAEKRAVDSIETLGVGILVSLVGATILALGIFLAPRQVSLLLTGDHGQAHLVRPLVPLVSGSILAICAGTYCRGRMWIGASNSLQLLCLGVIPAVVLIWVHDIQTFLWWSGSAVCAVSGLAVVAVYLNQTSSATWPSWGTAYSLLQLGLPRVPGDLAYYGLFTVPAIAAAYNGGLQAGGDMAYAIAWLTLAGQLVAPISALLLPEASYLLHVGEAALLRRRVGKLVRYSLTLTTFLVAMLIYWGPEIITLHLGVCRSSQLHAVRLLLIAAIPLNLFLCLRSVIDAGESSAISPRLCLFAFATFCVALPSFWRMGLASPVVYAFVLAMSVLAVLAMVTTSQVFSKHLGTAGNRHGPTSAATVGG